MAEDEINGTVYNVSSWGNEQLARLRAFFHNEAKPGDSVIFDRKLAIENAPSSEKGLNDMGCNSWVYHVTNQALSGLSAEEANHLADTITLTTADLKSQYPEDVRNAQQIEAPSAAETDDYYEPLSEEEEWAEALQKYNSREPV